MNEYRQPIPLSQRPGDMLILVFFVINLLFINTKTERHKGVKIYLPSCLPVFAALC